MREGRLFGLSVLLEVMMNKVDLAWAAGFIDGEGTVYVCPERGKHTYNLRLLAAQTVERPLRMLQTMFGGTVYSRNDDRKPSYKHLWTWQLTGAKAKEALHALYPYLQVKNRQAAIGMNFPVNTSSVGKPRHPLAKILQEEVYKALHRANSGVSA